MAIINGTDPFEIRVLPDLSTEMGKKSRFLPRHFEAMNTRLDRARSRHRAPFDAGRVAPSGPGTAECFPLKSKAP
ncbi:MAG: hypothetical protein K0M67_23235 [Thiobacillus sp.]|nr:hypothetical protein [Thiobacillus sp.]